MMFFSVFIQALAEVNITFFIELLAALITRPVLITIVLVIFRILVMVVVLFITIIRKRIKKYAKSNKSVEKTGQSAPEGDSANACQSQFKEKAPGVAGAGSSAFREGSWQGATSCFKPTCYDRYLEECSSPPLEDSLVG